MRHALRQPPAGNDGRKVHNDKVKLLREKKTRAHARERKRKRKRGHTTTNEEDYIAHKVCTGFTDHTAEHGCCVYTTRKRHAKTITT
jgi:hypothetical protein